MGAEREACTWLLFSSPHPASPSLLFQKIGFILREQHSITLIFTMTSTRKRKSDSPVDGSKKAKTEDEISSTVEENEQQQVDDQQEQTTTEEDSSPTKKVAAANVLMAFSDAGGEKKEEEDVDAKEIKGMSLLKWSICIGFLLSFYL